jgi:MATE family multidrug resistance protein
VFRLAVPMMLAYLSVPLVGIIDTAVIGRLGDPALLGGIAVGAIVLNVIFVAFNFLRSGTTGLTAQAFGSGDQDETVAVLARALCVALVSGATVLLMQRPLVELGALLMDPGPAVDDPMRRYIGIRIWATPFTLANYVLLGWLLGLGRSATALAIQTLFGLLNIVVSVWFVIGLKLGVAGVAWSAVLAELITVLVQVPLILRLAPAGRRPSWAQLTEAGGFAKLLAVNRDIMIRSFSLIFAFALFTRQGARFGEVTLAANAVLMQFFVISGYFLDGFATAAEQLAGRAVGARLRAAFDQVVRLTTLWGFATALLLTAGFALFGRIAVDLMTSAPEVRDSAYHYLLWAAATPLAGTIAFQMDGIFIGATWSRDMRNMMLLSVVAYLAALVCLSPFGGHGLWAALLIFLGARSLLFSWRMRRLLPATSPA